MSFTIISWPNSVEVFLPVFFCVCQNQDEDEDVYTNIHDLRNAMEQISTKIGEEASHIAPNDAEPSMDNMMRLDAEFREKQNQLQTLIEQRKYVFFSCAKHCSCSLCQPFHNCSTGKPEHLTGLLSATIIATMVKNNNSASKLNTNYNNTVGTAWKKQQQKNPVKWQQ